MIDYFVFGNVDTRDYDMYVYDKDSDSVSPWEYSVQSIPGRNGDILIPQKRIPNAINTYNVILADNADSNFKSFKDDIFAQIGYQRLEDSFHTTEFYQAYCSDAITPIIDKTRRMIKFQIVFSRKPQRFLKSGETVQVFTGNIISISNPTRNNSLPLIKLTASARTTAGTITINGNSISLSSFTDFLYIDIETMEAGKYYIGDASNLIKFASFNQDDYSLLSGQNEIRLNNLSNVSSVEITPRWWIK